MMKFSVSVLESMYISSHSLPSGFCASASTGLPGMMTITPLNLLLAQLSSLGYVGFSVNFHS